MPISSPLARLLFLLIFLFIAGAGSLLACSASPEVTSRRPQGRYEGGVYYRPALWGDASFNTCAGMGDPGKSSAFVHANMPFGAGGLLTAQDSWDVATFLDCQQRPVGTHDGKPCTTGCPAP